MTQFIITFATILAATQATEVPKTYTMTYGIDDPVTVGQQAYCALTITPTSGHVLKTETPFRAKVKATKGVKLASKKYTAKNFVDDKAPAKTIHTNFTATTQGSHSLTTKLSFFICNDELCSRFREEASCAVSATKKKPTN